MRASPATHTVTSRGLEGPPLDPLSLPPFTGDVGKAFAMTFSVHEKLAGRATERTRSFLLRENLLIAACAASHQDPNVTGLPTASHARAGALLVETEDTQRGVIIQLDTVRLLTVRHNGNSLTSDTTVSAESPLVPVYWAYTECPAVPGGLKFLQAAVDAKQLVQKIPVTGPEMDDLVAMLRRHQALVQPARQSPKDRTLHLSFFTPAAKEVEASQHACDAPGCPNPGTKRCGGCQRAFYCGPDCSKLHWKAHKPACRPVAQRPFVELDPRKDPLVGMARSSVSMQGTGRSITLKPGEVSTPGATGKMLLVKVQMPPPSTPPPFFQYMIYDEHRTFVVEFNVDCVTGGLPQFLSFTQLMTDKGMMGPDGPSGARKAYLDAMMTAEGKMRIFTDVWRKEPW